MTTLNATGLVKRFPQPDGGSVTVVDHIDLTVSAGERLAIVGPSGSGKSTLLNCLSALETTDSGTVELLGQDLTQMSGTQLARAYREKIGFVFQQYNLVGALSAYENVALPLRLGRKKVDRSAVTASLSRLGLGDRLHARPAQLSGGEQQRVAVARAMITSPRIIFADEPTGALDSINGLLVMDALEAATTSGTALVYVTHDPVLAARAERVILMRDGKLVRSFLRPKPEDIVESLRDSEPAS